MYTYRVHRILSVYDGDTVSLDLDLGFFVKMAVKCRLHGIDTPEIRGGTEETRAMARQARDRLKELAESAAEKGELTARTHKDKRGKYGRWLVELWKGEGVEAKNINRILVGEGLAKPYSGGKR